MGTDVDVSRYTQLFLTESREHVGDINAALLALERGDSGEPVARLFRAVHSIKGMAGAMGYRRVAALSHATETLLDDLRSGARKVSPALVASLFAAADGLERGVEAAAEGQDDALDVAVALDAIRGVTAAAGAPALDRNEAPRVAPARAPEQREAPRAAQRSVRVDARRLDSLMNLVGELEIGRGQLERVARAIGDERLTQVVESAARIMADLRDSVLTVRMVPVGQVFDRFPRLVRDVATSLSKEVDFELQGGDIELDRSMLDHIGDPIMHLLRNSLDHGLEHRAERVAAGKPPRGRLTLAAAREGSAIVIRVSDDGRGIDRLRVQMRAQELGLADARTPAAADAMTDDEMLRLIARPGFSTAERVTAVSGRGVGIDAVDAQVRALGGAISVRSEYGAGTEVSMRLPLTVAIVRALLARIGDETYAIPLMHVGEALELDEEHSTQLDGQEATRLREEVVRVIRLRDVLGLGGATRARPVAVTVEARGRRAAVVVDELLGQREIVVKRFDSVRGALPLFGGATLLSDGAPALIVDVNSLI